MIEYHRILMMFNLRNVGVLNAKMFGPSCMQPRLPRSGRRTIDIWNPDNDFKENCLTLNIWTPYPRRTNSSVMVWKHAITKNFFARSGTVPLMTC